jgi:lipid-binding SYLF domain-containing protein
MDRMTRRMLGVALLGAMTLAGTGCSTSTSSPASGSATGGIDRASIDRDVDAALADLYAGAPGARTLVQNAEAVLVFPSITTAGLGLGGGYGTGAMRQGGRSVGYYNLVSVSFGWQIGAQSFSQAYFFNTAEALETFKENMGFEAGVGFTAVAADFGATGEVTSSTLQEPVVVTTWSQAGLMAGATIEGLKITEINP